MTDSVVIVDEEPATDNWKIIGGNSFIAEYDLRDDRTEPVSLINVVATLTMRATTEDPSTIVLINSSVISTTGLILVDTSLGVVKCYFNPD